MAIVNTKQERNPGGRKPSHEGEVKSINFHFRANPSEKRILDSVMTPSQWRDFCVLVSVATLSPEEETTKIEVRKRWDKLSQEVELWKVLQSVDMQLREG